MEGGGGGGVPNTKVTKSSERNKTQPGNKIIGLVGSPSTIIFIPCCRPI